MKKLIFVLPIVFLAFGFVVYEDADIITTLREKLSAYQDKRVKLDLFFNQDKYAPGGTALVRTLYLSAKDLKPVSGREVIYLELFDQSGARVLRNQLLVNNGLSANEWKIPESLTPGIYAVMAYSDWMKNMDPSLFFRQDFIVVGKEKFNITNSQPPGLKFFPEGGSWISGVENKFVIQKTGDVESAGVIIRKGAEEIAKASFDGNGLAEFKMIPQSSEKYTVELPGIQTLTLPEPAREGIAIQVSLDQMKVKLQSSEGGATKIKRYFILSNAKGIAFSRSIDAEGSFEITLPADLPHGVAQIAIVDENKKVFLQRTIFVDTRKEIKVSLRPAKKIYSTRQGVDVEVEVVDNNGNPMQASFATRVTNHQLFGDTINSARLSDNLLLYSDLSSTFRPETEPEGETLNRYLITQSCPWLDWNNVLSKSAESKVFGPKRNINMAGKVTIAETGQPLPDSSQVMFFLEKQIVGYEVETDRKGQFNFPVLFDFQGTDQVFYSASRKGRDITNIVLQLNKEDSSYSTKARSWVRSGKDDPYGTFSFQKKIIDNSFNYFSKSKINNDSLIDFNSAIEDELQGADYTLTVKDFILFPTMPDLIREVLRSVDYRKIRGREIVRVYTTNKLPNNFAGPLYVIDGILTKNTSTFLSLKPSDIITIKIVKNTAKLIKFGSLGANGVILVRTNLKTTISRDNSVSLTGMLPTVEQTKEGINDQKKDKNQVPDLRACLYWESKTSLDANGRALIHFTTADDTGKFKIHIEGLTVSGIPFSKDEIFEVKFDAQ
jgi:hypothetical protein